jgi:hypothetical protein
LILSTALLVLKMADEQSRAPFNELSRKIGTLALSRRAVP